MSWAHCGTDSQGREIGYAIRATCDHLNCSQEIDRGLSYVCGGMHGEDEVSCERYFCERHQRNHRFVCGYGHETLVCGECARTLLESGEWVCDLDGQIVPRPPKTPNAARKPE